MSTVEKLKQIRALALTAKTSIYNEDAMTAIELAGVTACKVNEVVDIVNKMIDAVEDVIVDVENIATIVSYDIDNEELTVL